MWCPAQHCKASSQNHPPVERLMLGVDPDMGASPWSLVLDRLTNWTCPLPASLYLIHGSLSLTVAMIKQRRLLLNEWRSLRQIGTGAIASPRESGLLVPPEALGEVGMAGEGGRRERE